MEPVEAGQTVMKHEQLIQRTLGVIDEKMPLDLVKWPNEMLATPCLTLMQFGQCSARVEGSSRWIDLPKVRDLLIEVAKRYVVSDGCIGLAAPQAGMLLRAFVCHLPKHQVHVTKPGVKCWTDDWEFYINPTIIQVKDKKLRPAFEQCLSQPGRMVLVPRPEQVVMRYQDIDGEWKSQEGFGLLARCWQHEIDHTRGINIGVKA